MMASELPAAHVGGVAHDMPHPKHKGLDHYKYETTADGDVRTYVVEPSFDANESTTRPEETTEEPPGPSPTNESTQSRSDDDDHPDNSIEKRSSPLKDERPPTHERNLSAHFFEMAKIRDDGSQEDKEPTSQYPVQHSKAMASPITSPGGVITYSMQAPPPPISPATTHAGVKHRRGISADLSSPAYAHRRINSIGNSAPVYHQYGSRSSAFPTSGNRRHHREDSAGLDMLSAAIADVSKEELAEVVGAKAEKEQKETPWEPPIEPARQVRKSPVETLRVSPTGMNSTSYAQQYPADARRSPTGPPPDSQYAPPPPPPPQSHPGYHSSAPPPHASPYPAPGPYHGSYYHHPPPPPPPPPPPQYHHQMRGSPPNYYPPPYSHPRRVTHDSYVRPHPQSVPSRNQPLASNGRQPSPNETVTDKIETDERLFARGGSPSSGYPAGGWGRGTTTGVQTHLTSISTGDGGRTVVPNRTGSNNKDVPEVQHGQAIPSSVGHHRKLSSFSSLGTLMNSGLFTEGMEQHHGGKPSPHHRTMSSTTSFLQVLDESDPFLQSLHAQHQQHQQPMHPGQQPPGYVPQTPRFAATSPVSQSTAYSVPPPQAQETPSSSPPAQFTNSGRKLASGGTSKRVRRKCTVADCPNRVVQGGLCIAHGAKRKTCKHPGCTKNVKKAGLCSTHGPARKRCDAEGCTKVAVQGGRCIAHGAKKKLCSIEGCAKQAILSGMCKKHHDAEKGLSRKSRKKKALTEAGMPPVCVVIDDKKAAETNSALPKASHRRGLSIFQEMSADSVKLILSEDGAVPIAPQPGPFL